MEEPNDILEQLKQINRPNVKKNLPDLTPDELHDFIVKKAGRLITRTIDLIEENEDNIAAVVDADHTRAHADLIKAAAAALDTLTKLQIGKEKNQTIREVKQNNMAGELTDGTIRINREELLRQILIDTTIPVEGEVVKHQSTPSPKEDHTLEADS